ncbi:hypothetical protein, partial [Arachidicoccus sp.]|uniref:hypothetical protein n=1 Tax=Arachidicoccus sp. TaxID=1872624 RepID=UPI003D1BC6DE
MNHPSEEQIGIWAEQYLKGTISEKEKALLEQWYDSLTYENIQWADYKLNLHRDVKADILYKLKQQIQKGNKQFYITRLFSAAAILLLLLLGTF